MPDYIDETEVESLLDELQRLRSELSDEKSSLQGTAQPVELDQQAFGRVSRGDALQQQNMAKASLSQCEERIRMVDEALRKIDKDEYGLCELCDQPISLQRLHARPESRLCIDCQGRKEQDGGSFQK